MNLLLEIRGLSKNFGGVVALQDFDLELRQEESLGLIGPNGAGKSTLLNLIAGVFPPTSGRLWFRGGDTTGLPAHKLCLLGIAKTFQITRPFAHLSVLENVTTAAFLHHPSPVTARRRAREWIAWVGLEHVRDRAAGTLSTAQRKRLEVARALATEPQLLLLDEVFSGLNGSEIEEALEWAGRIPALGVTLIVTEHLVRPVAALARRVVALEQGVKICDDTTGQTLQHPLVRQAYFGSTDEPAA